MAGLCIRPEKVVLLPAMIPTMTMVQSVLPVWTTAKDVGQVQNVTSAILHMSSTKHTISACLIVIQDGGKVPLNVSLVYPTAGIAQMRPSANNVSLQCFYIRPT